MLNNDTDIKPIQLDFSGSRDYIYAIFQNSSIFIAHHPRPAYTLSNSSLYLCPST
jgi:hypothetical protein